MTGYRDQLEAAGLLTAFERAREMKNFEAMRAVLYAAKFKPLEIDSILWSKGENVERAPTGEEEKQRIVDAVIGRLGTAVISGVILGGVFVYGSMGGDEHRNERTHAMMKDYRTPKEAYYRPFIWGFGIGGIVGLVTGTLAFAPASKKD